MSQEPREISLVISLLVDGENIASFEPSILSERPRGRTFVMEVTSGDTAPLDPKFAGLPNAAIRTVLTNNPGLHPGQEKTN